MRTLTKLVALVAMLGSIGSAANAEQLDRRGFPIPPVQYRTVPCALPSGCAQVNVGSPHGPHRPNVRMPFTQQNVHGRQMVIRPPNHGMPITHGGMTGGQHSTTVVGRQPPRIVNVVGPREVQSVIPPGVNAGAIVKGQLGDPGCFKLPNGNMACPNHFR